MTKRSSRPRIQSAQSTAGREQSWLKEFGLVPALLLLAGSVVTAVVYFPAFYGVWTIVTGDTPLPSAVATIGLALLAAALAGVVFLLARPRSEPVEVSSERHTATRGRPPAEVVGGMFVVAAIALALFAILCPFLGVASVGQWFFPPTAVGAFSEVFVKWVAMLSLLIGTAAFVAPLTLGPFLFASDILRRKRRGRALKQEQE